MFSRMNLVVLGGITMAEITKVVLDAMGGDNAPAEMVKGAVDAIAKEKNVKVFLVGREDIVRSELDKDTYDKDRIIED